MPHTKDLKAQRDRFLAFAFAAADMLVEVDSNGTVTYTSGAVIAITGLEEDELVGLPFHDLFPDDDLKVIQRIISDDKDKSKQGPFLLKIKNTVEPDSPKNIFLSSFSLRGNGQTYITISLADALLSFLEFSRSRNVEKIATMENFETMLRQKIPSLLNNKEHVDVQLLQLDGMHEQSRKLDQNTWSGLTAAIAQLVMESSIDGETAVKVDDEKYMIVKDAKNANVDIQKRIQEIAKQYNIEDSLNIQSKNIEGDLGALSPKEASRAILYTIKKMESDGLEGVNDNLQASFAAFLEENANKISNLKRIFSHQDFKLNFQPIYNIKDRTLSHHEVLVRFDSNQTSPYELITMGEDIGLAPDMDLSICRQALKYADKNKKRKIGQIAVNLSGVSIQSDIFVKKLISTLDEYPEAAKHLMFEITESSEIKDLDRVDGYIQQLRKKGYAVCLDDFGAGSASFQYLHKLKVDGIKIDGAYIRNITNSPRDATMVKSMSQMCHEMGVYVVAEMIENSDQESLLRGIGIDKGQGWLYGRPSADVIIEEEQQANAK